MVAAIPGDGLGQADEPGLPAAASEPPDPGAKEAARGLDHYLTGTFLLEQGQVTEAIDAFRLAWEIDPEQAAVAKDLARAFRRLGEPDSTVAWARVAARLDPEDPEVHFLEGISLVERGRTAEATASFRRAWELDPTNPSTAMNLVAILDNAGETEDALALIWPTVPPELEIPPIYARRAELLLKLGRPGDALNDLAWALSRDPGHPEAARLLIALVAGLPDPGMAVPALEEILRAAPEHDGLRHLLARVLSSGPNWRAAVNHYRILLARRPGDPELAQELGILLFRDGDLAGALEALEAAQAAAPRVAEPMRWLWRIAMVQGRYDDALTLVGRLEVLVPGDPEVDGWRAATLEALGRDEEAFSSAEVALQADPTQRTAGFVAASVLARRGEEGEAARLLGRLAKARPEDREARFRWGAMLERAGEIDSALVVLEGLLEEDPDDHRTLNHAAYSCIDRGIRLRDAMGWIVRALAIDPENSSYLDTYGWGLYQIGKYDDAVEVLRAAVEANPGQPVIMEHLGRALMKAGRPAEAEGVFRRALELDPENADLLRWLDAISGPSEEPSPHLNK